MTNAIKKGQYPEIWDSLTEEHQERSYEQHRKGSTFFVRLIYYIKPEYAPSNPELHGFWETDTLIWCDNWGLSDKIETLHRVEPREKVVTTKEWVRVG